MAWLAVDKDGRAFVYSQKPFRIDTMTWMVEGGGFGYVSDAAVDILVGRELTWEDVPVMVGEIK